MPMDGKINSAFGNFEHNISFSQLLELAADNDVEGFKEYIEFNPKEVDEVGLWYGRQLGARGMVLEYRTPLMVASMYGSLDVMKYILSLGEVDVNRTCGTDKCTALHCAAFGGSVDAVEAVRLLLVNGADFNVVDIKGNRPYDVIKVSWTLPNVRVAIEDMLMSCGSVNQRDLCDLGNGLKVARLCIPMPLENNDSLMSDREGSVSPMASKNGNNGALMSDREGSPSPMARKNGTFLSEKKEYPVDPSFPDIKNSIYATDEFRMYSFKVRPCSRAYSHDWTECPFVHPGENARRRDPRKYHYSCVPCPEFRKGSCQRGDMCEYAHGVFECWLHPAQYRTRLCKDGASCNRRVCFFAHLREELRPLYASTGSAVPSPRSVTSVATVMDMDMAAALNLFPSSPSGPSPMSPSPFTPPFSPSGNGISHSNIPTLHLPGSNIQPNNMHTSRLRSSINARDISLDELSILQDLEMDRLCIGNLSSRSRTMAPSNLNELFSSEISSPRYSDPHGGASPVFSPSHKSAVFNHFQQQQSMLSPIDTKVFSPKASLGPSSPRMISSPRGIEPQSPFSTRFSPLVINDEARSLSARDLGADMPRDLIPEGGSMVGSWSNWDPSINGRADWSMNGEEPDVSWVQSLVKDSSVFDSKEVQKGAPAGPMVRTDGSSSNAKAESVDQSNLGAWLDQIAAQ